MSKTMKKTSIALFVCVFALTMCLTFAALAPATASADPVLPFALTAPYNLVLSKENPDDHSAALGYAYSMSKEMNDFINAYNDFGDGTAYLRSIGVNDYDEVFVNYQVDWALDDPENGWHWNAYWETAGVGVLGTDGDGFYHSSSWDVVEGQLGNNEISQNSRLFPGINQHEWDDETRNQTILKSQLKAGQYEVLQYDEDGDVTIGIDYSAHTMYVRSRFVITTRQDAEDTYQFSAWSAVVAYGKDAAKSEVLKEGDVPAPVVTGLRLTDKTFNGNPVVAFTLTVPDTVIAQVAQVKAGNGTYRVEAEARVKGTTEWINLGNVDGEIKTGELEAALGALAVEGKPIPAGTEIELRARYYCYQPGQEDIYSVYSNVIDFHSDEIKTDASQPAAASPTDDIKETIADKLPKSDCPICHICPQPLGLCIFIWLVIILVIVAVVVVVLLILKKRKNKNDDNNE